MNQLFRCRVVTPDGVAIEKDVVSAIFPSYDGLMGVLYRHAPMITAVDDGVLSMRTPNDEAYFMDVGDGFAEIRDNMLTILVNRTGELLKRDEISADKQLLEAQRELKEKAEAEAKKKLQN